MSSEHPRKRARAETGGSEAVSVRDSGVGSSSQGIVTGLEAQLTQLQTVQAQLDQLEEEASAAILEIQRKTTEIQRPLYQQRDAVTAEIDTFWLTAILGCAPLAGVVTQVDEGILEHCTSMTVDDAQERGWTVRLAFRSNPFFANAEVAKSCTVAEDGVKYECSAIEWKPGQKPERTDPDGAETFFGWLSSVPDAIDGQEDMGDSDWVGEIIVHTLWPRAVDNYLSGLSAAAEGP